MPRIVDVKFAGYECAVGAWLRDGVIIDPGTAAGVEHLLAGLGGEQPRAVLLTHIHLDHAGAAGFLVERFPDLKVHVHEIGAPHIADPERLVASSKRVFGEERFLANMGEPIPIPAEHVVAFADGDTVEGLEVMHAPGHAGNHVCFLDPETGDAYVGDVAGVRIEPGPGTVMPTPPPEIDIEAWIGSISRLAERRPETLRLTHFGTVSAPEAHLEHCKELLREYAAAAHAGDRQRLDAAIDGEAHDEAEAELLGAVVSADDAWAGLERWAQKHSDARIG